MTGVTAAVSVLAGSMFVAALIKIIAPTGKTDKILKLVLSLFMLVSIAVAIENISESWEFSEGKYELSGKYNENLKHSVDSEVLKSTGDYIAEYIKNLLSLDGAEIEIGLDVGENSVIKISAVNIYIKQKDLDLKNMITETVEEYFDITPMVIVRE